MQRRQLPGTAAPAVAGPFASQRVDRAVRGRAQEDTRPGVYGLISYWPTASRASTKSPSWSAVRGLSISSARQVPSGLSSRTTFRSRARRPGRQRDFRHSPSCAPGHIAWPQSSLRLRSARPGTALARRFGAASRAPESSRLRCLRRLQVLAQVQPTCHGLQYSRQPCSFPGSHWASRCAQARYQQADFPRPIRRPRRGRARPPRRRGQGGRRTWRAAHCASSCSSIAGSPDSACCPRWPGSRVPGSGPRVTHGKRSLSCPCGPAWSGHSPTPLPWNVTIRNASVKSLFVMTWVLMKRRDLTEHVQGRPEPGSRQPDAALGLTRCTRTSGRHAGVGEVMTCSFLPGRSGLGPGLGFPPAASGPGGNAGRNPLPFPAFVSISVS